MGLKHTQKLLILILIGRIRLTLEGFTNSDQGTGVDATTDGFILFSAALDTKRVQVADLTTQLLPATTAYAATTTISNAQIVVQQVGLDPQYEAGMMKRMRDGGSIEIDIPSVTNYKHSLLKTNRIATVNVPVSNTRAKSMIIMPTDATVLSPPAMMAGTQETYEEEATDMDGQLHSIRHGQCGIIDRLTQYQMEVDSKLVPAQPIVVSKINKGVSIAAQPLIELEKALMDRDWETTSI